LSKSGTFGYGPTALIESGQMRKLHSSLDENKNV